MLGIQKYSEDQLIDKADIAIQKCQEALTEIFDAHKGNKIITDTIKTVFKYEKELYSNVKSMHLRYKLLTDGYMKYKDEEITDLKQKISEIEIHRRDPKISTYEAMREIDKGVNDLLQNRIK